MHLICTIFSFVDNRHSNPGAEIRARGDPLEGRGGPARRHDLPLRRGVWVVVGPAGLACAERALPPRDAVCRPERRRLRQPLLHRRHRAVLPRRPLPPPLRRFHPLRRPHPHNVHLHHPLTP